ncbi:MAG: LuxR C-terminal-related transcriptional regulator [candidate division Zixibacteria bacterium]|nr:LuxR C-terminal-related transcriptional regulator [candidate division Zixibacteria bacterium]
MSLSKEYDFAEVLVDKLFLESFANEQSPYYNQGANGSLSRALDKFRSKLKWHVDNSLSPRQKQVIRYYLSGKKEREIAEMLGITQQVVNIYKQRAIKKLQRTLVS